MAYAPPPTAKPFTLSIPDSSLSQWRQLLTLSPLGPDTYEGRHPDRRYGVTHDWMASTKDYWLNTYSWRKQEAHINSFPNYTMHIEEGIDVHFVALFSQKKDAVPIIWMHGWPGSFVEFLPMLGMLRERYPEGEGLPYHIVVPSLPGYTLSSGGPVDRDWTMQDSARVMHQLMVNLGFEKYIAQGGDVGSFVAKLLAVNYEGCVGIHLNMSSGIQDDVDVSTLGAAEKAAVERTRKWRQSGMAYAIEHATRPSTIGHVLSSSPLALMAWIGEKFLDWTDADPPIDIILTNISLYWFTNGFPRSIYPYRAIFSPSPTSFPYVEKPCGFSWFMYELMPARKEIVEQGYKLVTYRQHEQGGHFAALEKPQQLLEDVEEYVGKVWKRTSARL